MKQQSVFDEFTKKYQLSKTLRFELKPVGKTADFLKINKVFEKDKTINNSYNQAKFYFDTLHQNFINAALAPEKAKDLPFSELADFLEEKNKNLSVKKRELKETRDNKNEAKIQTIQKEINDIEKSIDEGKKKIYKIIRGLFDDLAEQWKKDYKDKVLENEKKIKFSKADIKQSGVKFLTSAGILQILKHEFPKIKEKEFKKRGWLSLYIKEEENPEKNRYIFDSFDKFSGYLSKFQQTRDNLYANDGTSTAVATRIVSNFEIFLANKKTFDEKYKKNHREVGFNDIHIFKINNYHTCLLQKNIDGLDDGENNENSYNKIIGRTNQRIKEYHNQKESEAKRNKDKNSKKSEYPLFKPLGKQILGKVEKEKQLIEKTETKTEEEMFFERFKKFIDINQERFTAAKNFMKKFLAGDFASAYNEVYLKNSVINTISRRWFADSYNFEKKLPQQSSKNKKEDDAPKIKKFVTLADVKNAVELLEGQPFKQAYYDKKDIGIVKTEQRLWEQFLAIWGYEFESLFEDVKRKDGSILLPGYYPSLGKAQKLRSFSKNQNARKEETGIIKDYADASLRIFQVMKYLALNDKDIDKITGQLNTNFYGELDEYSKDFKFIKYYNAFRNFLTKKPFNEDKIKLNFENGALLKGWDENKEYDYMGVMFIKEGKHYLGIIHKDDRNLFKNIKDSNNSGSAYKKMVYKQIADASKDVPRLLLTSRTAQTSFNPSLEIKRIKKEETFKRQNGNFSKKDLHLLIDYYKNCIPKYSNWDCYNFKFKKTDEYQNIKEFTDDVQKYGYKIFFVNIENNHINQLISNGKLYLLEISNKDISNTKNGVKNLHTLYFEHLLSEQNISHPIIKLSGMAEIFQREPSIDKREKIITQKNKRILNKGERAYKNRRYTEPKIMFHISLVLNIGKTEIQQNQFNKNINQFLSGNNEINIIGIDRGEKNLLYYSVVNQKGEILDLGSLNKINGVNYHEKLVTREKERLEDRQSWQPVARIKDLKRGYISYVISKICQLIIKYNAIVVMEDLNMRFKQIRGGIERSVYQQFEKALINKLGYLVFKRDPFNPEKSIDLHNPGGVLNGYQLSAPFVSFEKMGKQTGIIFYTQADYTSITDPLTGFRKNVYISNSASQEKIKEAIEKIKAVGWDEKEQSYFFEYNPVDFVEEKYKNNTFSKIWKVYAKAPRIRREKGDDGYWTYKKIKLNEEFKELFKKFGFENIYAGDLQDEILRKIEDGELNGKKEFDGKERSFYHSFIYLFNLILQLRNSYSKQFKTKEEDGKTVVEEIEETVDFIASPVKPFFSTRAVNKKGEELSPANFDEFEKKIVADNKKEIIDNFDGDANGAYNIARKGMMVLKTISEKPDNPNLYISKSDWDKFTQK